MTKASGDGFAVVPHRAAPSPLARAMGRERRKCLACNGRGQYRNYRRELVNPCPVCKGSGKEPGR